MADTLVVHVGDLLKRPGTRKPVHREVAMEGVEVAGSRLPDGALVVLDAVVESMPDSLTVSGSAEAPWAGTCRRCLRDVVGTARADLREVYERHPVEGETWPLRGDQVDLTEMVREEVVLALPLAPVCQDDCQGLCPECGADRNESDCGHTVADGDPRWAALDDLKFD
jgi:uncharacterized protein